MFRKPRKPNPHFVYFCEVGGVVSCTGYVLWTVLEQVLCDGNYAWKCYVMFESSNLPSKHLSKCE